MRCLEYERLEAEVDKSLKKLGELTTLQLEIFRSRNSDSFMRMDKDLELAVGEKERTIGCALRQHAKEHKCKPTMDPKFVDAK